MEHDDIAFTTASGTSGCEINNDDIVFGCFQDEMHSVTNNSAVDDRRDSESKHDKSN
jgi:hypothetical protein